MPNPPTLTINNQDNTPVDIMTIHNESGEILVRITQAGNVEIYGDVNDAALRFWVAVAQFADGEVIKRVREKMPK